VVAKAAPRAEPVATPAPAPSKDKPQLAEAKTKPVATEEKARLVAKQVPASSESSLGSGQQYTVKAGDTLSRLAMQFYNSMNKWEKIYEANKEHVKNPNYIFIGQKLIIPADDKAS
jgi:nucleoid-associated protein YgaU